jgi:tripartite-type tricarboxylate transporter receptor subunit TctC
MSLIRRLCGLVAMFVAAAIPNDARAQTFPDRALTMIVPFPPGGNTDIMARALQSELYKVLGRTIVVLNKGGAAGTLGIIELTKANPDGYTVALTPNNPLTAQPYLQALPYGLDSFHYVCLSFYAPYVLMAGPRAPFKTFPEFVAFARAKPENLVYGHPGIASQPHLGMLAVLKAIGADALGVPFQGAGPMAHALLSGTVMAITETPAVAAASNLTVLAALADQRIPALPDVPTMRELGYPAEAFTAGGIIAPAGTPADVVAVLEQACAKATATADYKTMVERLNVEARYLPGGDFRRLFQDDAVRNADAIRRAGLAGAK